MTASARVTTYLRPKLEWAEVYDFTEGGVSSSYESKVCLAQRIWQHLEKKGEPSPMALFETSGWPDAPFLKRWASDYLVVGSEVYTYLLAGADWAAVLQAINEGSTFSRVGALTILPKNVTLSRGQHLPDPAFDLLVADTELIFLNAYDGEGWLFIDPHGRPGLSESRVR